MSGRLFNQEMKVRSTLEILPEVQIAQFVHAARLKLFHVVINQTKYSNKQGGCTTIIDYPQLLCCLTVLPTHTQTHTHTKGK